MKLDLPEILFNSDGSVRLKSSLKSLYLQRQPISSLLLLDVMIELYHKIVFMLLF